jgi:hypothetical protein
MLLDFVIDLVVIGPSTISGVVKMVVIFLSLSQSKSLVIVCTSIDFVIGLIIHSGFLMPFSSTV